MCIYSVPSFNDVLRSMFALFALAICARHAWKSYTSILIQDILLSFLQLHENVIDASHGSLQRNPGMVFMCDIDGPPSAHMGSPKG